MKMTKNLLVISILLILATNNVLGVEVPTTPTTAVDLSTLETKALIIEQNAKTVAEIKEYFERKTIDYNKNTQRMIDENFKVLDKRQDDFLREAGFKLGAVFLSGIVAGQLIVLLIKRQIDKRALVKKQMWDRRHKEEVTVPIETFPQYVGDDQPLQAPQMPQKLKKQAKNDVYQPIVAPNVQNPNPVGHAQIVVPTATPLRDIKSMVIPKMSDAR
jgi:hypothetical protein